MADQTFDWDLDVHPVEVPELPGTELEGQTGVGYGIDYASEFRMRVTGSVTFPNNSAKTALQLVTFWRDHGRSVTFLKLLHHAEFREVLTEVRGTSAGGSGESFALRHKHIIESTLKVYVATVLQPVADWDLDKNDTAPEVDTLTGFDAGEVTVSYQYKTRLRFTAAPTPAFLHVTDDTLASPRAKRFAVSMREESAGASLVAGVT